MRREDETRGMLVFVAAASLALLLQGMAIWHFFRAASLSGSRGLLVCALVVASHGVLAVWRPSLAPRRGLAVLLSLASASVAVLLSLSRVGFHGYGLWKAQGFILFSIIPAAAIAWNLAGRQQLIRRLFIFMLFGSCIPLALPLLLVNQFGSGPLRWLLTTLDVDVIGLGRTLGVGGLLCVGLVNGRRRPVVLLLLLLASVMIGAQVVVGERGPVLAFLVGLIVLGARQSRGWLVPGRRQRLLVATAIVGSVVMFGALIYLFQSRATGGHEERRLEIMAQGWDQWRSSPLIGVGMGNFVYDPGQADGRQYIHNIAGEILVELGVLGMVVFLVYFWAANRIPIREVEGDQARDNQAVAAALLAFSVTASLFSGDLATNNHVWVSQALLYATRVRPEGGEM